MRRPARAALVVGVLLAVAPASAWAGPIIDQAAKALRRNGTDVYIDPRARVDLFPTDANDLRSRIAQGNLALLIAVLPAAAAKEVPSGSPGAVAVALERATDEQATYVVVVGRRVGAASPLLGDQRAARLARQASTYAGLLGPGPVVLSFMCRLSAPNPDDCSHPQPPAFTTPTYTIPPNAQFPSHRTTFPLRTVVRAIIAVVLLAAAIPIALRRRRRRRDT